MLRLHKIQFLIALGILLFCVAASAFPTKLENNAETAIEPYSATSDLYLGCPKFCTCTMPIKAHTKFLHAKCNQTDSLLDDTPIDTTYPIHSIDLSYLRLSRVSQIFTKLTNLTSINLSHNELHEIGHLGRRIKRLNLKHNRITSNKLSKLPENLKVLNLQHNDISYLPLDLMRLNQLTHLELSHNDINCTCDTLEVRDWLQRRHVFMENPVICSYPVKVKGKSWLQVKQSEMCEIEKGVFLEEDDENSLMSTNQPVESSDNEEDDELKQDFLPVNDRVIHARSINEEHTDFEGSGEPNDEEEGSGEGSGYGLPIIHMVTDNDIIGGRVEPGLKDDTPLEEPPSSFTSSPEMFDKYKQDIFEEHNVELPVGKETSVHGNLEQTKDAAVKILTDEPITETGSESIQHADVSPKNDSNATYLLLGIIGLLVLGLLLFVAIKRCNKKNPAYDAETIRQTELLDMDKSKLGKPLQRNGTEHAPLIGEKTKVDQAKPINGSSKKPYDPNDVKDGSGQQLLTENGKNGTVNESQPENGAANETQQPHEYHPITPRYPTPKSPRASKYGAYPPVGEKNNNTSHSDAYLPSSPKSGRYSPVYSPETGRVKIKLTETPRPKTPMLVTRSRSNAGDIITTPVHLVKDSAEVNGAVH